MKKNKNIIYKNFIQHRYLNSKFNKRIDRNFNKIFKNLIDNLDSTKNTYHSLSRKFEFNFKFKNLKKFQKFKTVVIIGMGGSILGAEAIYSFLKKKIKKNFIFINNIDENKLIKIKKSNFYNTLFIIISKSGKTLETLSNFEALKIIKKKAKNIIIISEKSNNPLYLISKKFQLHHIEHKNYIGGRYSVLSEVGLLPAHLMGVNIFKIRKNIMSHLNSKNKEFLKESVKKLANLLNNNKFKNLIFFNYAPQLNEFLYWCQQLIAESLGKKGKGFLPVISPAPKDHHSLLQLYLDGPRDKIFYIFSLDSKYNDSLSKIKLAQKNAFLSILKKNKVPYREFKIRNFSEEVIGELFAYFMLETSIVGKTININPFNQPAVEQVKNNTKKILA